MIGADGTVYGLCGFSVNQTYFLAHHTQPTGIGSLACVLSDAAEGLDVQRGLLTYPTGDFCFVPDELLEKGACAVGLLPLQGRSFPLSAFQSRLQWLSGMWRLTI